MKSNPVKQAYTCIHNSFLQDKRLKFEDRGLLSYLLSIQDPSKFSVAHLVEQSSAGRDAVYGMLKRLQDCNYISVTRQPTGETVWSIVDLDANNSLAYEGSAEPNMDSFDLFWKHYPRKRGKKEAREYWKRNAKKLEPVVELIIQDVIARKRDDVRWQDGFVKDPIRYLRNEQWEDEIQTVRAGNPRERARQQQDAEFNAILRGTAEAISGTPGFGGNLEDTESALWGAPVRWHRN